MVFQVQVVFPSGKPPLAAVALRGDEALPGHGHARPRDVGGRGQQRDLPDRQRGGAGTTPHAFVGQDALPPLPVPRRRQHRPFIPFVDDGRHLGT